MFSLTYATKQDKNEYLSIDRHLPECEYESKVRDKRCYIIRDNKTPVGIMRYNLLCDYWPFITLIILQADYRRKGFGTKAMMHWENEMRSLGHQIVMTSTQADEEAQHFYRKIGYKDMGCLVLHTQPLEIFLGKNLEG